MYTQVLNQCFCLIMIYGVVVIFSLAFNDHKQVNQINKYLASVETEGSCLLISAVFWGFRFQSTA